MPTVAECPVCGGTGWRPAEQGAAVAPCECRERARAARAFEIAGIPVKYQACSFGNFDADWEGERNHTLWKALHAADKYAADYTPGDPNTKGLLFQGTPGVGKTHLLVALLRSFCERGIDCLFLDYQELLRRIQHSYNTVSRTTEYELLQPVLTTEVVAIDDLGNNRISDWVEDTVTYVVNHRYSQNRPTLFTANLFDEPMSGDPGKRVTRPTFEERLGPRVASRLREMCRFVELRAADYRARGH